MLAELIDRVAVEEIIGGLSRATRLRIAVFDADGSLLSATPPQTTLLLLSHVHVRDLPAALSFQPVDALDPPTHAAFVEQHGLWFIVTPVRVRDELAGYVSVGDFRAAGAAEPPEALARALASIDPHRLRRAWEALPELPSGGDAQPIVTARWAARLIADWCRHELLLDDAAEGLALVGDIGALLAGEQDLGRMLQRIVADTARVTKCEYCSLRLYNRASDELTIAAVHNLSQQYIQKGRVLRSENPIDDLALRGDVVYIEDAQTDPRIRFPEEARRQGIRSGLTAGLIYRGEPIGVLRVYTNRLRRFRGPQRQLLRAIASQAAVAIVNARLAEQRLRADRIERQIEMAGQLQERMLRNTPPDFPAVQAALLAETSWHVGGDFSDFLLLRDGRFLALIGDAVGHGITSALLMSYTRGFVRSSGGYESNLAAIVRRLNEELLRDTELAEFVTLLLVAITPDGRSLSYCSAGHEPPLLCRRESVTPLAEGGMVLGVQRDEPYDAHQLSLEPGDFLLLYTDGAVEALNFAGESFGRSRLERSLVQHGPLDPALALRNIRWDVRRFVGLAEQTDDITLIGLKIRAI